MHQIVAWNKESILTAQIVLESWMNLAQFRLFLGISASVKRNLQKPKSLTHL